MSRRLRAGIAGLGQVGLLFDDDPKRTGVWTHFSAYERLSHLYDLVAVCEPDPTRCARALARNGALLVFPTLGEMLERASLDVVSICTPPDLHLPQIAECAGHVRGIICEKPLAGGEVERSRAVLRRCEERGTVVAVNYYKRYEPALEAANNVLRAGGIGELQIVSAFYAGPLEAVGSHALDLITYLAGPVSLLGAHRAAPDRLVAMMRFGRAGMASLVEVGPREDLVFEIDLLGSQGRLRILDNVTAIEHFRFEASERYGGYRELRPVTAPSAPAAERFLPLFEDMAAVLHGADARRLRSDGRSALASENLLESLRLVSQHVH